MKNNGPCADIAGSAGEGLRKTKEEHQREKETKSFLCFWQDAWQPVFWPDAEAAERHR